MMDFIITFLASMGIFALIVVLIDMDLQKKEG